MKEQQQRAFFIGYATALIVALLIWAALIWATKPEQIAPAKARIQAVKIERETEGA